MAIKGGSILHVGNGVTVVDRVQTGGPGQLNVPTEKINELGNYKSVATVRDTPDLSFTLESLDVSTEIEAMLTGSYQGRNTTDAAMTVGASSTTLNSATAAFTSDDVGRAVVVAGAGTAGAELASTIVTLTSPTAVVLADPAVTTVSGAALRITVAGGIDLTTSKPLDVASQWKAGRDATDPFRVTASVAVPFLYLEQMSYRFGLRDNASQSATLRGDAIFYNPGPAYTEEAVGTGVAGQTIATTHPAYEVADGDPRRILSVTAGTKRLAFGADYTEAYGAVAGGAATTTVTITDAVPTTDTVRIMYSSPDVLNYPDTVHAAVAVKPAAVKGRDIEIYVGGYDPDDRAGSLVNKMTSVQSVTADWRVTLDADEEFGNHYSVARDFDVATVNGSVDIKPRDNADALALIRKITGVTDATKVLGPSTAVPLALDIVIKHPDTGVPVKRLHVPDARFTVPGYQGRVTQKLTVTLPFESDEGELLVFER